MRAADEDGNGRSRKFGGYNHGQHCVITCKVLMSGNSAYRIICLAQSNNVCSVSKKEIWQHNAVQIFSDSGRKLRVSSNAEFPVDVAKVQSEK